MNLESDNAIGHPPGPYMRVRITKTLTGSVDGMQLSRLLKGHVYDVYTMLACYLLSEEVAEPATHDDPIGVVWAEKWSRSISLPWSVAADRSRTKKAKKN